LRDQLGRQIEIEVGNVHFLICRGAPPTTCTSRLLVAWRCCCIILLSMSRGHRRS
jgi:hypothetical protein